MQILERLFVRAEHLELARHMAHGNVQQERVSALLHLLACCTCRLLPPQVTTCHFSSGQILWMSVFHQQSGLADEYGPSRIHIQQYWANQAHLQCRVIIVRQSEDRDQRNLDWAQESPESSATSDHHLAPAAEHGLRKPPHSASRNSRAARTCLL